MKKILCIIDSLGAGGAQRQMVGLASYLKEFGYDVSLVFYHPETFYEESLQKASVSYVYFDKATNRVGRIFQIYKFIRKVSPDVVISYLDTPSICSCLARIFNRSFKLIVSERNTSQANNIKEKLKFTLFRLAYSIVPNSHSQSEFIIRNYPSLSNKVVTIPNFVDLNIFTPPASKVRREIPLIMVAATIWPSKNTLGFIDAVDALRKRGYKFCVEWYGKDMSNIEYYNTCYDKINELKLRDYITLKEKETKINLCYQKADYFCLPSFYEGCPNVICEAMASGLPIACSDVCDNSKYVQAGNNGFLFNPSSTETIVGALEQLLLLSDQKYNEYSMNSRDFAERLFSKETFVQSYIKLIE